MLTKKIFTGVMLEWPPEADRFPVYAIVPAKPKSRRYYIENDEFRGQGSEPVVVAAQELVPDEEHPEYERMLQEGIRSAEERCAKAWEEYIKASQEEEEAHNNG